MEGHPEEVIFETELYFPNKFYVHMYCNIILRNWSHVLDLQKVRVCVLLTFVLFT